MRASEQQDFVKDISPIDAKLVYFVAALTHSHSHTTRTRHVPLNARRSTSVARSIERGRMTRFHAHAFDRSADLFFVIPEKVSRTRFAGVRRSTPRLCGRSFSSVKRMRICGMRRSKDLDSIVWDSRYRNIHSTGLQLRLSTYRELNFSTLAQADEECPTSRTKLVSHVT